MTRTTTRAAERRGTASPAALASPTVAIPALRGPRSASGGRAPTLAPTVARWPIDLDAGIGTAAGMDAALAIVRACLIDYRSGRADRASRLWHDDISWSVPGAPPVGGAWKGAEGIFGYHDLLVRLSDGTFRQELVALEGSRGSMVNAYLRTSASRAGRRLEIPSLAIFELGGGLVRRVTELPGDRAAWESFWAA